MGIAAGFSLRRGGEPSLGHAWVGWHGGRGGRVRSGASGVDIDEVLGIYAQALRADSRPVDVDIEGGLRAMRTRALLPSAYK